MEDPSIPQAFTPPEAPEVDLGWGPVVLEEPPPLLDVAVALTRKHVEEDDNAAMYARAAAALFLCWPPNKKWPARRPKPWVPGQSIGEYGQKVYGALRQATKGKCSKSKLHVMMLRALTWTHESGMTAEALLEARNFSEGQGEE